MIKSEPITLKAYLPEELLNGSVVLDRFEVAWQRLGRNWYRGVSPFGIDFTPAVHRGPMLDWVTLVSHRGPVKVLYVPATEEKR